MRSSVCIWNSLELEDFRTRQVRPSCELHDHISRDEAIQLTQSFLYKTTNPETGHTDYFFEAFWVDSRKCNAIVFTDPRTWEIRGSRVNGAVFHTHQLVPLGK